MPKILHLAVASTTSKPGAVDANLEQIVSLARQASEDGAHLLLTPEMSASGYGGYPEVLATAEVAGKGKIYDTLAAAAHETGVAIGAGFVEQAEARRHLSHYVVFPDGRFIVQRKHCVTLSEQPLESQFSQLPPFGGDGVGKPDHVHFETFEIGGVRAAISICADNGIAHLHDILDDLGVQLLLAPAGAGGKREDRVTSAEMATPEGLETYQRVLETVFFPGSSVTDCIKHRRTTVAVNLCGYDGQNHYHVGHGMIVTAMGEVPAFFHGIPNLDRQRHMYAHAEIDFDEHI